MMEALTQSIYFGIALSLLCFQLALWIKSKVKSAIANPLLVSVIIIIAILLAFGIDYDTYYKFLRFLK